MVLKQIELQNFRLHRSTSLNFSDNLNIIIGGNGHGKTTILEAIYYLCTTKNLNLSSDNDAVLFGEKFFMAEGRFLDLVDNNTRIFFDAVKNKKSFFINDKQITKAAEIIGVLPIVVLIQSDHAITLGSPSDRRRFVDSVISQTSHTYLEILLEYYRTLRQRSSLLSQIKEYKSKSLLDQLDAWSETLLNTGAEIINHRVNFVNEFNKYIKQAYKGIIEGEEEPKIEYSTLQEVESDNIKKRFSEELIALREDELRRGVNLVGPHRDDFIFYINNLDLRRFGSQGQHKTFQIALRFAQFFYMKEKLSKTPIFLLDDVFGELDSFRAGKISSCLSEIGQAFITMTDFTKIDELNLLTNSKVIKIKNGTAANT
jgi:DNA replication and repair protein RecF